MMQPSPRFAEPLVLLATKQLQSFCRDNTSVVLALLTSSDGFEVAASPALDPTAARMAAMSSSMQALSESLAREANLGKSRSLMVETDSGAVLVLGLSRTTIPMSLTVVAVNGELLGRLLWESKNLCSSLEKCLPIQK